MDRIQREREVHELSVCGALIEQVSALAAERGAMGVRRISIEVGPLSGVDPLLLQAAFGVLRAGSCAAGAELCIDTLEVHIRCTDCKAEMTTAPNRLVCAQCGSLRSKILQGDELRLRQVELNLGAASPLHPHAATGALPARVH